jgi:hypothetical protein
MNKADRRAVETAGMKCLQYVAGYTIKDQARNGLYSIEIKHFQLK